MFVCGLLEAVGAMKLGPAKARALLTIPELRRIVERACVQVNAEVQALRLEAWQQTTGRKHPAGRRGGPQ